MFKDTGELPMVPRAPRDIQNFLGSEVGISVWNWDQLKYPGLPVPPRAKPAHFGRRTRAGQPLTGHGHQKGRRILSCGVSVCCNIIQSREYKCRINNLLYCQDRTYLSFNINNLYD